ncbi:GspE/PulE family protein [Fusibacter sp. JL216-2]|uniref:GspE/PulE family protein n=1 Tax=Fusibacter sp. JL216-2 TaxID=3071453 RepID=UPI003D343BDF
MDNWDNNFSVQDSSKWNISADIWETVDLKEKVIPIDVLNSIPQSVADKHKAIAFDSDFVYLHVAMADPSNIIAVDDIKLLTEKLIKTYKSSEEDIQVAIARHYSKENTDKAIEELKAEYDVDIDVEAESTNEDGVSDAPSVRLANSILTSAIEAGASDIHIEPFEHIVYVRLRIDGVLKDAMTFPKKLYSAVSTRLKIIADMDIAEKRKPQDGRIEMKFGKIPYDFRVSSLPTVFGEKIVLRILDRTGSIMERKDLGFTDAENKMLDSMLFRPDGIMLVTGPTGSGKTTTLYSFLKEMSTSDKNTITIEDPVEYMLPRINQVNVNNKAGLTFAAGLKSMLRQDPDIIMLGEIRDEETASIAVRASITGHFVLSTLHTNDAPSTITRLLDMGVEPYLVADAVVGIIAQRLIRRLCPFCKKKEMTTKREEELLNLNGPELIFKPQGCDKCNDIGFKGRLAVHEILMFDVNIKNVLEKNGNIEDVRKAAAQAGMKTLKENTIDLIWNGETTVSEMVKIVNDR